jgi:lipid-A-disaccharide synthase
MSETSKRDLSVFIVAGEHSGDALGGKLMLALNAMSPGPIRYTGVGGHTMGAAGLVSVFPLDEIAVMGATAIMRHLPTLVRRVYDAVDAAIDARPDVVVIIDAPEFTHPIARRIRKRAPAIPIIDYVSPSVWAWRPGRAAKMRGYVDHVLALLPFEPSAHVRLGGPACSYVGHPLSERTAAIATLDSHALDTRLGLARDDAVLVVLPGSRRSEVDRLLPTFGATICDLHRGGRRFTVVLPVVPHLRARITSATSAWPVPVHIIEDDTEKFIAFRRARAALAASGTVTLELGLAGVPAVVGYRVDPIMAPLLRRMIKAPSTVLTNLILERNAVPEFHQEACVPVRLAAALTALLDDTPTRATQVAALAEVPGRLAVPGGSPSRTAAEIVLRYAQHGRAGQ